jgi:hypothetical protein
MVIGDVDSGRLDTGQFDREGHFVLAFVDVDDRRPIDKHMYSLMSYVISSRAL